MIWTDGENKYDIKTQSDTVINTDIKFVYKGSTGTPVSASHMNIIDNLKCDSIEGTTQVPTYSGDDVTKIEHKLTASPYTVIRTDTFTYSTNQIVEVRALITGETISYTYNFDANGKFLETVVV